MSRRIVAGIGVLLLCAVAACATSGTAGSVRCVRAPGPQQPPLPVPDCQRSGCGQAGLLTPPQAARQFYVARGPEGAGASSSGGCTASLLALARQRLCNRAGIST